MGSFKECYFPPQSQKAIDFADTFHDGQFRKSTSEPYVVHPIGVAEMLLPVRCHHDPEIAALINQNTLDAAVLHDVVELSKDKSSAKQVIRLFFNAEVARIVDDLTEPSITATFKDETEEWLYRKERSRDHISHMQLDSVIVKSADVLYNFTGLLDDYKVRGDAIFQLFKATKALQLERLKLTVNVLFERWPQNPFLPNLWELLNDAIKHWQ